MVDNLVDNARGDHPAASGSGPSDRARELLRGAYDLHLHVAPDVIMRRIDDVSLAFRFQELGLAGFALKSHYTSTAERAQVVAGAVSGVDVVGTLTLNQAVGGLNPLAVEIAAREGARIVWLPTVDAVNEVSARDREYPEGVHKPLWAQIQSELGARGLDPGPVAVVGSSGEPLPELQSVLSVVAEHGLVLGTGHLSRDEIFTVVEAARQAGVRQTVITHPEFPAQDLSEADQVALAERGALLERCFTTPHTAKCSWERVIAGIRATGPENNLLSTDLGQPANPPVEDGLALFADVLLAAGLTEREVTTMTVGNSRRLAGVVAR